MISTVLIKEKFSKASQDYDKVSSIQKEIADEFLMKMGLKDSIDILDIGVGTAYLTKKIKRDSSRSAIYGLDLALGMLYEARKRMPKIRLIQADANSLPFADESFDLVVSNLTYQWVSDLSCAFSEAKRVLKNKGSFYFTVFAKNTLKELKESVLEVCDKELDSDYNLPDRQNIEKALIDAGFKNIKKKSKIYKYYYSNLSELLIWLKTIGANRYWSASFYKGLSARCFIEGLTKYYEEKFKDNSKILATFEVLFVEANK
jgi:malonyl-CoA O-methyltransferase